MLPEVASYLHACEGEAVTKLTNEKIPYFNAPIYLENKTQIGKVEEIFGPINEAVSFFLPHVSARTARDCVYVFSRANWFYLRTRLSSRPSIADVSGAIIAENFVLLVLNCSVFRNIW
jgi:rRNA processing protein Gar1